MMCEGKASFILRRSSLFHSQLFSSQKCSIETEHLLLLSISNTIACDHVEEEEPHEDDAELVFCRDFSCNLKRPPHIWPMPQEIVWQRNCTVGRGVIQTKKCCREVDISNAEETLIQS